MVGWILAACLIVYSVPPSIFCSNPLFIWKYKMMTTFQKNIAISLIYVYLDRKRSEIWPKEIFTFPLYFHGGFKQMVGWLSTMSLSCVLPSGGMWHHHPVLLLALFGLFHDNYVNVAIFISTIGDNNHTSMLLYEAITPFSHLSTQELHYYLIKQCDCTIIN